MIWFFEIFLWLALLFGQVTEAPLETTTTTTPEVSTPSATPSTLIGSSLVWDNGVIYENGVPVTTTTEGP